MKSLWKRVMALANDSTAVAGTLIGVAVAIGVVTLPLWVPALHLKNWWHNKRTANPNNTPGDAG